MSSVSRGPTGIVAVVVASLCVTLLGGCAWFDRPDGPVASESPTAPSTPAVTPSPSISAPSSSAPAAPTSPTSPASPSSPAPPPSTTPPLASLTITTEGLGPLALGSAASADSAAALVIWDATHCVGEATGTSAGDPYAGAWLPVYPNAASPALGERPPFYLLTADGYRDSPIREVNVWAPEISSDAGVRAGDSRDRLLSAYPTFDEVVSNELSTVYALNGENGRLLFEVANESDRPELAGYWGAAVDTVLWMRAVPRDAAAAPIAASDAGGPCVL